MKKIIPILLLTVVFIGCQKKTEKAPISFQVLNFQMEDQWGRKYGLTLDSAANAASFVDDKKSPLREKKFIMNEKFLDSISHVVSLIDFEKTDTLYKYKGSCTNCVGYNLNVVKAGKNHAVRVMNILNIPEAAKVDSLANLIYKVVRTADYNLEALEKKQ